LPEYVGCGKADDLGSDPRPPIKIVLKVSRIIAEQGVLLVTHPV